MRSFLIAGAMLAAIAVLSASCGGGGGGGGTAPIPPPPGVTLDTITLGGVVPDGVSTVKVDGVPATISGGQWSTVVSLPHSAAEHTVEVALFTAGNPLPTYRRQLVIHKPQ